MYGRHSGSDVPNFDRDKPLVYDKKGLSTASEPDAAQWKGIAACVAKTGVCMTEYRADVLLTRLEHGISKDVPFTKTESAQMAEYIRNCETCGEVCGAAVLAGLPNPWPYAVPTQPGLTWTQKDIRDMDYSDRWGPDLAPTERRIGRVYPGVGPEHMYDPDYDTDQHYKDWAWDVVSEDLHTKKGYFICDGSDIVEMLKEYEGPNVARKLAEMRLSDWTAKFNAITARKLAQVKNQLPDWMRAIIQRPAQM